MTDKNAHEAGSELKGSIRPNPYEERRFGIFDISTPALKMNAPGPAHQNESEEPDVK